jgi:hypothetical protein
LAIGAILSAFSDFIEEVSWVFAPKKYSVVTFAREARGTALGELNDPIF